MGCRALVLKIIDVGDGLTRTILFAEMYICPDHYFDGLDYGDNENAYTGSDRDTYRLNQAPSVDLPGYDNGYAFGGAHPGIFLAAMCDGSAQTIGYEIDLTLLRQLMQRNDGSVVKLPE